MRKKIKFSRIVDVQYKFTAPKFNLIVYSKDGRGARLDKLVLCSLKLLQCNKKLVIFNKKSIGKLIKSLSKLLQG